MIQIESTHKICGELNWKMSIHRSRDYYEQYRDISRNIGEEK